MSEKQKPLRAQQFDPGMVDAFFDGQDMINSIAERYPDAH